MGITTSIRCSDCEILLSINTGGGFRSIVQSFEFLVLNVLSKNEAAELIRRIPRSEGDIEIASVSWDWNSFACPTCFKVYELNDWQIEFTDGRRLSADLTCDDCRSILEPFYPERRDDGTYHYPCPSCGNTTFLEGMIYNWD